MTLDLRLHHILVTGAAGAIGAALARELRRAWPAARLALLDRPAPPCGAADGTAQARTVGRTTAAMQALATELGPATVSLHAADLRDLAALPELVARITAEGGALDGLVNCAGVMQVQQLAAWDWAAADELLAIDLLAPLRLQALVARAHVERGGGDGLIVNVSSMAGRVPLRGCAYYGAAKAGLAMASEVARADLAEHGIRVVTVYPGPVKSALEQGARDAYGGGGLLGRLAPTGDPAELAQRVVAAARANEPRVIYPRAYGVGWSAPNLSSWIALSYGPPPMS